MSNYSDFIQKNISNKIVLFELDSGDTLGDNLWVKDSPGVWKTTYAWLTDKPVSTTAYGVGTWGAGIYGTTSSTALPTSPRDIVNIVGSLEINGDNYTLVPLANVATTPDSFYWSSVSNVLYVNFPSYIRDEANVIVLGITFGYSTDSVYFNDIYYEGRIKSIPSVTVKQDNLFKAVVRFEGGTVTLINTDGEFDHFGSNRDIYGKRMRIKFGGDDLLYSEYEDVYTGYIEKYKLKGFDIPITVKDERKNLQRKIPNSYYSSATYPYIKDAGGEIAIGYGVINRAPAICLNEELTTTTYNFKFVNTFDTSVHDLVSIDQVYVDGIKVTHSLGSITSGTFNLADTVYEPGQDVSVSFHGYDITNPLDIIEDLLLIYADVPYTSDFYNTTDWEAVKLTVPDVALFVEKGKTLISVIGEITSSIFASLIIEGDGRINIKVVDLTKTPVKTIRAGELIMQPGYDDKSDDYVSSARVGYNKAHINGVSSYYTNNSEEEELVRKYRSYKEQEFKTLLTTESDASDFSDVAMSLFGGIVPQYTIMTPMLNIDVELEDVVDVELYVFSDGSFGIIRCEVISKTVDYTNSRVSFTLRKISEVTANISQAKFIKWKA